MFPFTVTCTSKIEAINGSIDKSKGLAYKITTSKNIKEKIFIFQRIKYFLSQSLESLLPDGINSLISNRGNLF